MGLHGNDVQEGPVNNVFKENSQRFKLKYKRSDLDKFFQHYVVFHLFQEN
jgi:hypothetical protein